MSEQTAAPHVSHCMVPERGESWCVVYQDKHYPLSHRDDAERVLTIIPHPSIPDLLDSLEGCQPFVDADLLRLGDEGPIREAEHAS